MWRSQRFLGGAALGVFALVVVAGRLPGSPASPGMLAELIHGSRPSYTPERVAQVPNEQAIIRRFWAPELDEGYNPQGLAVIDDGLAVSAYKSETADPHRGPCRVFRIETQMGHATGRVDVPALCGNAGGVAIVGDGNLYVTGTRALFATLLRQAFSQHALPFRGVTLGPGLTGALGASSPGSIWLGTSKEDGDGVLFGFDRTLLAQPQLTVADATARLPIPSYAQGAAFDQNGKLWVSRGSTRWGELVRLNPTSGAVEQRYAVAAGIKGIAFDGQGLLWAVSEAGSRDSWDHFLARRFTPFFPLVFALDTARLE